MNPQVLPPQTSDLSAIATAWNEAAVQPGIMPDPWMQYTQTLLDQSQKYPDPEPIIRLIQHEQSTPLLTRKSFSLWQGKAKSKKSTMLALTAAAMLRPEASTDQIRLERATEGKVIYFDTEQGTSYAARTLQLILKLAGLESSPLLEYSDLRGHAPEDRLRIIKAAIEGNKGSVCLVIIDGVVDVINDFMDNRESQIVISDLLALCSQYNLHVAGVLHQNKGDQNARGHTGTIAGQKCEIEISATADPKDKSVSIIKCEKSRGIPFEDIAIRWDTGSLPVIVQEQVASPTKVGEDKKVILLPGQIARDTHQDILKKVFKAEPAKKYGAFLKSLHNEVNSWYGFDVSEGKAKSYLQYYVDEYLVKKTGKTPHTLYSLNQ